MRIFLFSAPFMSFFAASLFFDNALADAPEPARTSVPITWRTAAITAASVILLGSFLFTYYGDERVDYISHDEWNAAQYLYRIAPTDALLLEGWYNAPLYFKNYAKYRIWTIGDYLNQDAVTHVKTSEIIHALESEYTSNHFIYIIFSQEEQNNATLWYGLPPDLLQRLETTLLQTKKFRLIYRNADAQILQFVEDNSGSYP